MSKWLTDLTITGHRIWEKNGRMIIQLSNIVVVKVAQDLSRRERRRPSSPKDFRLR